MTKWYVVYKAWDDGLTKANIVEGATIMGALLTFFKNNPLLTGDKVISCFMEI